eukprot:jgi/Picre1/30615/NNA_005976.t1
MSLESKKAELAIELEREKQFQQHQRAAKGLSQGTGAHCWNQLLTWNSACGIWCLTNVLMWRNARKVGDQIFYVLCGTVSGFVEVVRREGPRENSFLQRGNPQGSDTLFVMVEAIRFVLCASPTYLESWYVQGPNRNHPGARMRQSREEIILSHKQRSEIGCPIFPEKPLLRISRGHQRAIGTYMITTKMGAERHIP